VIAFPNPGNGVPGVYLDPLTPGNGMVTVLWYGDTLVGDNS